MLLWLWGFDCQVDVHCGCRSLQNLKDLLAKLTPDRLCRGGNSSTDKYVSEGNMNMSRVLIGLEL